MQPLRISLGHSIKVGGQTVTFLDVERSEYKGWKLELKDGRFIVITPPKGRKVFVPLSNVAYCEFDISETNDNSRSETKDSPVRAGQEGKGKGRTS